MKNRLITLFVLISFASVHAKEVLFDHVGTKGYFCGVSTDYKGNDKICGNVWHSYDSYRDNSYWYMGQRLVNGDEIYDYNYTTYNGHSHKWIVINPPCKLKIFTTAIESVSDWTTGTPFILSSLYVDNKNVIRWEHSSDDGFSWEIVKEVPANPSYETNDFDYIEESPQKGNQYYRYLYSDGTYSDIVKMHIYDAVPQSIATKPLTQISTVDESVTLTLDVVDDDYSYQWYHNGSAIEEATTATYTIDAVKAADAGDYYCTVSNPASSTDSTPMTLTVNKCAQEITFPEIEAVIYGDTTSFTLPELTNKGLKIVYQSSNPTVATVSNNSVSIHSPGTTNITANQQGDVNYLEAPYVTRQLTVNKRNQVIDFPEIAVKTFEDLPFALPQTTDEGLTISYSSLNQQVATIEGNIVTITGAGTSDIIATQAGDATHNAAISVSRLLTVNKQTQSINFPEFTTRTYGDALVVLNETSNRGLPITYTSDSDIITIDNNRVVINRPGEAIITATQEGNKNFKAADPISRTLIIHKAGQSLSLTDYSNKTYGDEPFTLPAITDKELPVIYESYNESIIKVSGNIATITGAGEAQLTASQPGNDYYSELVPQTITVSVAKARQIITFDELPKMTYGDSPLQIPAQSNAGIELTFESSDLKVASIEGSTLTINGAGRCYITAYAQGNGNYYSASPVERELIVNKAEQTVTFGESLTKTYGNEPFMLQASASAEGALTFSSSNPTVITINGNIATITGAGRTEITARHSGNNNYNNADAKMVVTVEKTPLIATADNQTREYGLENPQLTISYQGFFNGDSERELSDDIIASTIASQNSNIGSYDIVLEPINDTNYNITYRKGSLTITKAPLTISAVDTEKVYGGANPDFEIQYSGFRNGQDKSELLNQPSVITNAKTMSKVGEYTIFVEGAEARNYDIIYQSGTLTINKAVLTAHLENSEREYGLKNSYDISYSGFKGSDTKDCILSLPEVSTTANSYSAVGSYPMTLQGGECENYSFAFHYPNDQSSAIIEITKAPLTIKADDKTMYYMSSLPRFTMSYSGFRNNDTSDNLDQFPHIFCDATQQSLPGTYPITLSGGYDKNYEFELVDGVLTILDGSNIYISSITIDPQELSIPESDQADLSIVIYPENASNKDVIWSSSDPQIVEVHDGHLIALSEGEAIITVSATDGSDVSASCKVTVTSKINDIREINSISEDIDVYDLRGVKVGDSLEGLAKGVYIVRQGAKTTKLAI